MHHKTVSATKDSFFSFYAISLASAITLSADRELKLTNSSLKSNQILLELSLFSLQLSNLILKLDILCLLTSQVAFQLIVNSV